MRITLRTAFLAIVAFAIGSCQIESPYLGGYVNSGVAAFNCFDYFLAQSTLPINDAMNLDKFTRLVGQDPSAEEWAEASAAIYGHESQVTQIEGDSLLVVQPHRGYVIKNTTTANGTTTSIRYQDDAATTQKVEHIGDNSWKITLRNHYLSNAGGSTLAPLPEATVTAELSVDLSWTAAITQPDINNASFSLSGYLTSTHRSAENTIRLQSTFESPLLFRAARLCTSAKYVLSIEDLTRGLTEKADITIGASQLKQRLVNVRYKNSITSLQN